MTASLVYDGAYAGGRVVDDYVGVKAIAPSVVLVAPSGFGRVWSLAFTGAFFLTGAYRLTLLGFAQSFARIPPCYRRCMPARGPRSQPRFAENFLVVALQVAAPALASGLRRPNRARRALSRRFRASARFTLAFPLAFAAALIATAIVVPLCRRPRAAAVLGIPGMVK